MTLVTDQQIDYLRLFAEENENEFKQKKYPGRVVFIGMTPDGYIFQFLLIGGRNPSSRSRQFQELGDGVVRTKPIFETKNPDPNTIYQATEEEIFTGQKILSPYWYGSDDQDPPYLKAIFSGSNGYHTTYMTPAEPLGKNLAGITYENDRLNTSRIGGRVILVEDKEPFFEMAILRKSDVSDLCEREIYTYPFVPGFGYTITTYVDDGNPPLRFQEKPYCMSVPANDLPDLRDHFWENLLNNENAVASVFKLINPITGHSEVLLKNKYSKEHPPSAE